MTELGETAKPHEPDGQGETSEALRASLFCPQCMYDLRGIAGEACPECGFDLDRARLKDSSIPWVSRRSLGMMLKTAWRVGARTKLFSMEVARPVSLADARSFRRWVAALVTLSLAAGVFIVLAAVEETREWFQGLWDGSPGLVVLGGLFFFVLLALFALVLTGAHLYWFHPRALPTEQQNRAHALAHYACAPMLLLFPGALGVAAAVVVGIIADELNMDGYFWVGSVIGVISGSMYVIAPISCLFVCDNMAHFAAHRGMLGRWSLWLGVPLVWVLLAGLLLGVLPAIVYYIYLMVVTL